MATKLYLHSASSSVTGTLPTDEQSSLTPDANDFEGSRTTNRLMNTTIGVSQANLTNTSTGDTSSHNYYITRFVSPLIYQGAISANTWTFEYGAKESNAAANFPVSGTGVAGRVNCYIWKPSDGTKVGTILDGNTNADCEEAGTSQSVINCTFTGAAVTGLTPGDAVLIIEMWAIVTQGNGTQRTQDIYYDGTTENSTSNEAAFLSTPENLQFTETADNMTAICSSFTGSSTANTTQYLPIGGNTGSSTFTTTEAEVQVPIRTAGTLSRLGVRISTNGIAGSTTLTVRKNAADTGIVVTLPSSTTGYFEDLTNTVSVSAGDKISIKSVPGAATGTYTIKLCTLHFTATDGNSNTQIFVLSEPNNLGLANNTRYQHLNGRANFTSTEADTKIRQRVAGTYSGLAVYVSANARTTSVTFKSRKNGADGNLAVTFAAGETGLKEDTTHSDTVAVGDDYNLAFTYGSGTETMTFTMEKVEFTNTIFKGILSGGNVGTSADQAANLSREIPLGGSLQPLNETNYRRVVRHSTMVISDLHVYASVNTITADSTATLLVNGSTTALTTTITNSTTGLFSDTTHSVTVGSNDTIAIQVVTGATGTNLRLVNCTAYYRPTQVLFSRTASETITTTDSASRFKLALRTISETVNITQSVAEAALKLRSMSETITTAASIVKTLVRARSISETITTSDSVARLKTAIRTISETINITQSVAKIATKFRSISETITTSDTVSRFKLAIRPISETITLVDSVVRQFISGGGALFERSISETITLVDSISRYKLAIRVINETINILDSIAKVATKFRSISEIITTSDSISRLKTAVRVITQIITTTDSASRFKLAVKAMSEVITTSDSISRVLIKLRSISETITTSDSINRFKLAIRNIGEVIIITSLVSVPVELVRIFRGAGAGGRRLMKDFKKGLRLKKRNLRLKRWTR